AGAAPLRSPGLGPEDQLEPAVRPQRLVRVRLVRAEDLGGGARRRGNARRGRGGPQRERERQDEPERVHRAPTASGRSALGSRKVVSAAAPRQAAIGY